MTLAGDDVGLLVGGIFAFLGSFAVGTQLLEAALFSAVALFLDDALAFAVLLGTNDVAHGGSGAEEVGVVGVDIGSLDGDERLDVCGSRAETLAEKIGDCLDELAL